MFEAYLIEHGIPLPEHEPDLGVGKRPDYLVEIAGYRCLCEVKEFARGTNSLPGDSQSWDGQTRHKPIRTQVHLGARQLRAATQLGFPLVVVLTNPHRASVLLDDGDDVIPAIEGDLVIRVPRNGSGAAIKSVGLNGELRNDHRYLTAVVVLHEHLIPRGGHRFYARAFIPSAPDAVRLPDVFFRGPYDRVLEYSFERQRYISAHEPLALGV